MSKTGRIPSVTPLLDTAVERISLASLPTPVIECRLLSPGGRRALHVKLDNLTSTDYGGNKVRKLEYILPRARSRQCRRIATFGTVGSHHALATAIYSRKLGYACTCFLSHQHEAEGTTDVLAAHLRLGTRLVPYGGAYRKRMQVLRRNLWGEDALVVAPGGSSWQGTFGFVHAGRELAQQVGEGLLPEPQRLYVATGTMGSAAGLALGLALSGLATEIHAVRVSPTWLCNEDALERTMRKAAIMMRNLDRSIPADLVRRTNIRLRHEFFAGGYAHTDDVTDAAVALAKDQLDLSLETTYTGKAMAALLADISHADAGHVLFWNTCNSATLPGTADAGPDPGGLPPEFRRYFP